jgi:hypothetical protein
MRFPRIAPFVIVLLVIFKDKNVLNSVVKDFMLKKVLREYVKVARNK